MSLLKPETLLLLAARRPSRPIFSNAVLAEQFEAAHTFGRMLVRVRTDGKFAVVDTDRPVGARVVAVCEHISAADRIARLADANPHYAVRAC